MSAISILILIRLTRPCFVSEKKIVVINLLNESVKSKLGYFWEFLSVVFLFINKIFLRLIKINLIYYDNAGNVVGRAGGVLLISYCLSHKCNVFFSSHPE